MLGDKAMCHRHYLLDPLITLFDVVFTAVFHAEFRGRRRLVCEPLTPRDGTAED